MAGAPYLVLLTMAVLLVPHALCQANTLAKPPHDFLTHGQDLGWLLNAVERDNVVVLVAYDASLGHKPLLVNFAFALQRFGRVRSLVVVTADVASYTDCLTLGYTCFDAGPLLDKVLQSGAVPTTPGAQGGPTSTVQRRHLHNMPVPVQQLHTRRPQQETEEQLLEQLQHASIPDSGAASSTAPAWQLLSWARLAVAREAMQHNHTLLLAQVDTVYFKDTIRSLLRAADRLDADVIMMQDGKQPHGSSSNMFLRYSSRTSTLLDAWLAAAAPGATTEEALQKLLRAFYAYCSSPAACLGIKVKGQAAAWRAPFHGLAGDINTDTKHFPLGLCSSNLVFYQARTKYIREKIWDLTSVGLWFVKEDMVSGRFANLTLHHSYYVDPLPRYHIRQSRCVLPCPAHLRAAW